MAKVNKKDFSFDMTGLDGIDPYDPSVLGDPGSYGGNSQFPSLDTSSDGYLGVNDGGASVNGEPAFQGVPNVNLPNLPGLGGGGGQSGGRSNGGLTNADGSINWGTLLAMLAAGGGGLLNHNATQQATQQTLQGLHDTGTQVANTLGGAHAGFAPYMQAGQNALQQLSNMPPSNIAANFSPIGSGRGISLSRIARGS